MSKKNMAGVQSFILTQQQIDDYRIQANAGNLEAAKRLRDYYAFVTSDEEQIMLWAKKAADLGDEESKKQIEYHEKLKKMK